MADDFVILSLSRPGTFEWTGTSRDNPLRILMGALVTIGGEDYLEERRLAAGIRDILRRHLVESAPEGGTGKLSSSLRGTIRRSGDSAQIVFRSTDYVKYVIEGTGIHHEPDPHDMIRPIKARLLHFVGDDGEMFVPYTEGQESQNFPEAAFSSSGPEIRRYIDTVGFDLEKIRSSL